MPKCVFCGRKTKFVLTPKNGGVEDSYPAHKKCDKKFRSKNNDPQRVYAEGNNGGDYFDITLLDNDTIRLEVGHTCVKYIDAVVPVEFVTAALAESVKSCGLKGFIKGIGWGDEFTERLIDKVVDRY